MSSMLPTTETLRSPRTVSTRHSQETDGEAGRSMPPLREEETTPHLTEEKHSRASLTPLSRRMAGQLMEVPITERCQKTGSAQPAPGKIDTQNLRKIGCCLRKQMGPIMQDINTDTLLALHCASLVLDTDKPIYYRVQNASSRSLDSVPLPALISITLATIRTISIFSPRIFFLLHLILF